MEQLQINNLSLGLGTDKLLVKGLNLSIQRGEVHGLIGESGSGKSLTALSIVRLLAPEIQVFTGEVLFRMEDQMSNLLHLNSNQIRKIRGREIGFIFQDPMTSLNPSMKCGTQVAEILQHHNIPCEDGIRSEVIRLFHKVKLPDVDKIYEAYPHEISGGQRQRVMIAMAVACKPKLLIADEPTTALDVTVQRKIIQLLDELRISDGLAVLFITHDLGLIAGIADHISIMYRGEMIETGTTQEIMSNPKHPYARGLLACRPPKDKKLRRLKTVEEIMNNQSVEPLEEKAESTISNEVLLEVRQLDVYYELKRNIFGRVTKEMNVIKKVDFKINKGESLGLVGESGSGKTSIGRTLLNLLESRSGNIIYKGTDLTKLTSTEFKAYRRKIQLIFQDPYSSLNPKIKIGKAISEPLRVHGLVRGKSEIRKRALELMKDVGLTESDYDKYPHQFSGGQRQRVVIARALSMNPEFIVCDEAVSALDVSVQAQILNLLKDLQEKFGLTFLFITHDMSVVRFFCDRVLVLKEGAIVEEGKVDKVFGQPEHAFTKELIG